MSNVGWSEDRVPQILSGLWSSSTKKSCHWGYPHLPGDASSSAWDDAHKAEQQDGDFKNHINKYHMKSCENHKITLKHMTFPRNDFSQRETTSCWWSQPAPYFSSLSKISNPSHGTIPSKEHGRSLSRSMAMVIYNRKWPRINEQNLVLWHAIDFVSIFWWLGGHLSEMKCVLWAGSKSCWSRAGPIASYISFWLIRWLKSPSDFPSLIPFPY